MNIKKGAMRLAGGWRKTPEMGCVGRALLFFLRTLLSAPSSVPRFSPSTHTSLFQTLTASVSPAAGRVLSPALSVASVLVLHKS